MVNARIEKIGIGDLNIGRTTFTRVSRLNPANNYTVTQIGVHSFFQGNAQTANAGVATLSDYISSGAGTSGDPYIFTWATVMTDLGSNGGTVIIPQDYYQPDAQIQIDRAIHMFGLSPDSSVLYTPALHGIDKTSDASAMILENFTLLGDDSTAGTDGIRVVGTSGSISYGNSIKNVQIRDFMANGINLDYCRAAVIDGVRISSMSGTGAGILVGHSDGITLNSPYVLDATSHGISIKVSKGISVNSPFIYSALGNAIYMDDCDGVDIRAPRLWEGGTDQILVGDVSAAQGVVISGGSLDANSVSNYNIHVKKSTDCLILPTTMLNPVTDKIQIDASQVATVISNSLVVGDFTQNGTVLFVKGPIMYTGGADLSFQPAAVGAGTQRVVAIGNASGDTVAALDVTSTAHGVKFPVMTTTQRDAISSPPEGLVIMNTTTSVLNFFNGSAWAAI